MRTTLIPAIGLCALLTIAASAASDAKGTLTYKSKAKELTLSLTHAYLVTGPDAMDEKVTFRRLIFSNADLGPMLQKCATMQCTNNITEGLQFDLVAGPRFHYWLVLNGGLVQYSGTEMPASLAASTDTAGRVAGKLTFDGTAAGGPKVEVTFDAILLKTFSQAR